MDFIIRILLAIAVFTCTTGCITDDDPKGPVLGVGDRLPEFSVELNTGETVSTVTLRGNVPVIVLFNTNCSDCQKELPVIQQLYELYKDDPIVRIIAIAREESADEIAQYWKAHDLTIPYSPQEDRAIYNLFAPSVIPRIYIADKAGIVVAAYGDSDMPSLDALINDLKPLLNGPDNNNNNRI